MEVKNILNKIDALKSELDTYRPLDEIQEKRIFQKFRLDWNYHSSKIEGNALTYGETKGLLLFGITAQGKPLRDHFEITGHNEAIDWIIEVIQQKEPITEYLIRQLHELLLKEKHKRKAINKEGQPVFRTIEVGRYKREPNHVKTITGEMFYFATPEETPAKMQDLMTWYKKELAEDNTHPLVLAAEFHYRFIRIHPFDDGNGRMARLLMNLTLMAKGFPPVIIKENDKENYFGALRQADAGVLGGFVSYIGENLVHSLNIMIKGAKGESIEDQDDIDKEIALFKKSLEDTSSIVVKRGDDKITKIITDDIEKLFSKTLIKEKTLNDLFVNKSEVLLFRNLGKSSNRLISNFKGLLKVAARGAFIELDFLKLQRKFIYFKKNNTNTFSIISDIEVKFVDVKYSIMINREIVLEKLYSEQLTEEEINNIANQAAKSVLEEIKEKMK